VAATRDARTRAIGKIAVFSISLLPFFFILWRAVANQLGPDPIKELSLLTGEWTLRFLLLTLAITPFKQVTGAAEVVRYRRMIGLFSLWYASWHFLVWLVFLLEFRWDSIYGDILERPYITVGFLAFTILVILGITSPKVIVRRLGRRWKALHRLVYLAGILAIVHLVWIVRSDFREALLYGVLMLTLLGYRLYRFLRFRRAPGSTLNRPV
jgi:sulfoxide reductase heme-binding subunit YedZ